MKENGVAPKGRPMFNIDDLLLKAAKAYNLEVGQKIHRLSLFSYVQTHLSVRSIETLQGTLNNQYYFDRLENGYYSLNELGAFKMKKWKKQSNLSVNDYFVFQKEFNGKIFTIFVNPSDTPKRSLFVDKVKVSGTIGLDILEKNNVHFVTNSSSTLGIVFNWLVQSNVFDWFIPSDKSDDKKILQKTSPESPITKVRYPDNMKNKDSLNAINVTRIIGETELSKKIKSINNYQCQICGKILFYPNGQRYVETHHLRPSEKPHNGPDVPGNIICVCPNHHAELDLGMIKINYNNLITDKHEVDIKYILYHNYSIYKGKNN
jgi:hypothetical protein